jgi:hypothetical protein
MVPTLVASRALLVRSRLAVAMAPILMVRLAHSRLVVALVPIPMAQLVRSRLEAEPVPTLMVRLVRSLLEVQVLAQVRLRQPEPDSMGLPIQADSLRLVVALRRRTMRRHSSNPALRRSQKLNRCHRRAQRALVA